jgi:hypothetical protein
MTGRGGSDGKEETHRMRWKETVMEQIDQKTWMTIAYAIALGIYTIARNLVKKARAIPGVPGKPWYKRSELWLFIPLVLQEGVNAMQAVLAGINHPTGP